MPKLQTTDTSTLFGINTVEELQLLANRHQEKLSEHLSTAVGGGREDS